MKNFIILSFLFSLNVYAKDTSVLKRSIKYDVSKIVPELSGSVFDKRNNVIWTIPDSSKRSRNKKRHILGKIDIATNEISTVFVDGVLNVDWEAITIDSAGHLWILDVGDNNSIRKNVTFYKINPQKISLNKVKISNKYQLTYEAGPRNVEAGFIKNGKMYLVEKTKTILFSSARISMIDISDLGVVEVLEDVAVVENYPYITDATVDIFGNIHIVSYYGSGTLTDLGQNYPVIKNKRYFINLGQVENITDDGSGKILIGNEAGQMFYLD